MGEADDTLLPTLLPLGDQGLLVRFATTLSDAANRRVIGLAQRLRARMPEGATEFDPNLVSVLLKYDPARVDFERLAGELRLLLSLPDEIGTATGQTHHIAVKFGGAEGPDLESAAEALALSPEAFIAAHNAGPLRVLTTGFAPGFVYCGFHPEALRLPRRASVRPSVPPGSVLFAAGQTAIAATPIRTGWHLIGRTDFRNFDAGATPPTRLQEGDFVAFAAVTP